MNIVRLFIPGRYSDAYIYGGHVFAVVSSDNTVRSLSLKKITDDLEARYPKHSSAVRLAFERNDWLSNAQANQIAQVPGLARLVQRAWKKLAETTLTYEPRPTEWTPHVELGDTPLDFRFYAMRAYIAARSGVYESPVSFDEASKSVEHFGSPQRIFDGKTLALSSRAGEVVISAGSEGLYHATINAPGESSKVDERQVASRSLRSAWSGWNTINYESSDKFSYIENDVESESKNSKRRYLYSDQDETSERNRVSSFGTATHQMDVLFQNDSETQDVLFAFNSLSQCFLITSGGVLMVRSFLRSHDGTPHVSQRRVDIVSLVGAKYARDVARQKPCSASVAPNAVVLEYFDRTLLVANGKVIPLELSPAVAVRTFVTSRRFRRVVLVVVDDGLVLNVLPPPMEIWNRTETVSIQ